MPTVLSSVVLLLLATSLVAASDICAYASRNCVESYGCCQNILPGTCCSWPNNYGWSVRYQNMPASWSGRTFSDSNCQRQWLGISPLVVGPICKCGKSLHFCLAFETKKCIYITGESVSNNQNAANWLSANWGPSRWESAQARH
jgi:hypothetical protein